MAYSEFEQSFMDSISRAYFPGEQVEQQPAAEPVKLAAAPAATMTDVSPGGAMDMSGTASAQPLPELKAYDPTMRERLASFIQAGLEGLGMERSSARKNAQSIIGGPSSGGPLGLGIADIIPFLGTALQTEEAGRSMSNAATLANQGDMTGAAIEGAVGAVGLIPGAAGTIKAGKTVLNATKDLPVGMSVKTVDAAGNPASLADMPIAVKVGERQVKIPAAQAAVLSKAVKNLTPAEQAKFRSDTAKTFVEYLTQLPSKQEFAAAALGGQAKRGWYEGSTQAIVNVFGPDAPRFAALLSAMSPQTSVQDNLFNALQTWKNWTAAGRPTDRNAIIEIMGQSVQGDKGIDSVLEAWRNNSVRALAAEDPATLTLSGPKVDSFMKNLQGNVNEVTNDAWMAAFTLVDQNIFGGSITKTDPGKGPAYLAMNARTRETAAYLTKLTGETWTPAEVQETIWSWAKTLYEKAGAAGETRSAVQLVRDNALTDELIASTPDFRTLFYDQRFQPILEQAGYAEQLAQLRAATGAADAGAGSQKPRAGGKTSPLDPEAQRKLNERNAKRLDTLRRNREAAAAQRASVQLPTGANE